MSAGILDAIGARPTVRAEEVRTPENAGNWSGGWNPDRFAREQIRSLVRRIFSPSVSPVVRQVVFSAVEPETDVLGICRRVGEMLATETTANVAVVTECSPVMSEAGLSPDTAWINRGMPARAAARQVQRNLWVLPRKQETESGISTTGLHTYLGEVRREFEYSIVAAPSGQESNEAITMAQFADGIILVLSALRTRRATARRLKETLEQAHVCLLGTVLCDREFPMPEGIYRRL